ncbi:hypothetical protein HDU96_006719 [Phlyctochytrium bullatum]|nr:hypothetical protein HDU96_006719 [Phlyctochytrium bullatum]
MKRRALSADEKKRRLLELFHESLDFWTLKDLEKAATKDKGIVSNTVKEILEMLVADNEVISEKIGTSNYYCSKKRTAIEAKKQELKACHEKQKELERLLAEVERGREGTVSLNFATDTYE